jgi:hypothetical protein
VSRPKHSYAGYVNTIRMSRYQVFVFVEGVDVDPYFYGEICARVCGKRGVGYQVRLARELPGGAGGKGALVAFYRYARSRAILFSGFKGKRTAIAFCLDKDVDDLTGRRCRSPHVPYTTFYDVQNHLFKHCDFGRAVASAASISRAELLAHPHSLRIGAGAPRGAGGNGPRCAFYP